MGSLYNDAEDGDRIITPTHNHELDKFSIRNEINFNCTF